MSEETLCDGSHVVSSSLHQRSLLDILSPSKKQHTIAVKQTSPTFLPIKPPRLARTMTVKANLASQKCDWFQARRGLHDATDLVEGDGLRSAMRRRHMSTRRENTPPAVFPKHLFPATIVCNTSRLHVARGMFSRSRRRDERGCVTRSTDIAALLSKNKAI